MNLENVIGNGYAVAADSWLNVIVIWDGSGLFKMYRQIDVDAWTQVDSDWIYVRDAYSAKVQAQRWIDHEYENLELPVEKMAG